MSNIDILNVIFEINVNAGEQMDWVLTSENGEHYILENKGEIAIPSSERFILDRRLAIPKIFILYPAYPNPFNPMTTLRYGLPEKTFVMLTIYDMLGREITQLINSNQEAGFKSIQWDATDSFGRPVSAGIYVYQIHAGEFVQTRKLVLLK